MNTMNRIVLSLMLGFALALSGSADVFAARMGGGKSFGSRPSFSEPYRRSAPGGYNQPGFGQQPGAAQQRPAYTPAQQRNQSVRDSLAQRGGLARMLGGLAIGGLLGAMLFGGAFENLNLFDILIFGAIAFMLYKLFAARRGAMQGGPAAAGSHPDSIPGGYDQTYQRQSADRSGAAGFDTDILARKGGTARTGRSNQSGPMLPADFDAKAFLDGARAAYGMMQKAWDQGELADLRALTTDKVFGELQDQIRARGGASNQTELLKVDAEILEVRDVGSDREVAVLFDVLMREEPGAEPAQVREVWHFTRPRNSRQPTWFLDGIQQVED